MIIPKAMAYAMIAGLPVQVGLYTALVPMVIYAVLGTSRVLSVSTTTTLAILTAAQLGQVVPNGDPAALLSASATLTLLVGAALVLACLLRLGFVANFISEPVLVGFKAGIGLVIVVDQVPKILGIHFPRGTFVQNLLSTVHNLPKTSLATLAVGLTIIVFLLGMKRFMPKLPAPLLAAAAAIAGAYLLNLQDRGVELVGHIPQGMPSLVRPDLSLVSALWPGALGIALMSFTETVAAGQAFARKDEPAPRANTRAACDRTRQYRRRTPGCDAGRRRHNANGSQRPRGSSHAISGDRNCGDDTGDNVLSRSTRCDVAAICIGSAGDCLFLRTY